MTEKTETIPQPPTVPFLGNLTLIDEKYPTGTFVELAKKYGPIYKLDLGGRSRIIVSSWELVHESCDDSLYQKFIEGELEILRAAVHDGLFTSFGEKEENWGIAHRVLIQAFGPMSVRGMFDEMHEVANVGEDLTRRTLDTVALCSMGFRFNSYYKEELHSFIQAMYNVLGGAGKMGLRFQPKMFYQAEDRKWFDYIEILRSTAREALKTRKLQPAGTKKRKDLLGSILSGVDPKTGKSMTDESIIDNLITFLIAGHETTASTLQFTLYNILKYAEIDRKIQEEIDIVIDAGTITVERIPKLQYLAATVRETLRFNAPISAIGRKPKRDLLMGGKYPLEAGTQIICNLASSHLDPTVYGATAEDFNPDRMLDENFDRIQKEFPHKVMMAFAVLFQNFNFAMDNPNYTLRVSQTLTVKPTDFYVKAYPRDQLTPSQLEARLAGAYTNGTGPANGSFKTPPTSAMNGRSVPDTGKKIAIYYGSNAGTGEFMAQRLATDAASHGYQAVVDSLDAAKDALPRDIPVVIIASSYEGEPPQNGSHFVHWIQRLQGDALKGVCYAVWGNGHTDWAKTYQRIPKLIDETLQTHGAQRITSISTTNAKDRDMFSDFEAWEDEQLWPANKMKFGSGGDEEGTSALQLAPVTDAFALTKGGEDEKRHIELQLPTDWTYAAGDYLAVLPHNPKETFSRAMKRFHLAWDDHVSIQATGPTTLPTNTSIPVSDVLNSYVELLQPATNRKISILIQQTKDDAVKKKLEYLSVEGFETEVRFKRLSVLDILESFPSLLIPFQHFLSMLQPMRVRQYSISSSPLAETGKATLTYGVLDEPSLSGIGRHIGVASSYLASLRAGDKVQLAVRGAAGGFHLPLESDKVPIVLIAAGTGLAPFRAFIQERAIRHENGCPVAPAFLFYGCRSPESDDLYRHEFDKWEALGAVKVFRAFSRKTEDSHGCKYVQDRLWHEREIVVRMWSKDARIYVCGSNKIVESAKGILVEIIQEQTKKQGQGFSKEEALEWFEKQRNERFATDVFD
ncbi:Bifunctional P-450:NADPH-P450 reductase 4 [Colletotrichum chlorophyti]|uniref:Bifunctional cytochrome P450/NADPH--P450 reductase n=1 Tax=Colletotrichum chlorophyti TaxID=708187 RepID=A0A1Q8RC16_9PEZI|nr:Bifunctional P-450:NADPH-P450 reductase 4 [Colletotrichum chlorophyti]